MSDTENQPNAEQAPQPTPEQIAEYRKKMTTFYKEEVAFLKPQKEYFTLLADIEEQRAKRFNFTLRLAEMMAGPEQEPDSEKPEAEDPKPQESVKRKLKTDE